MRQFPVSPSAGSGSSDDERPYGLAATGMPKLALIGAAAGLLVVGTAMLLVGAAGGGGDAGVRPAAVKRLGAKTNLNSDQDPFSDEGGVTDMTGGAQSLPLSSALAQTLNQTELSDDSPAAAPGSSAAIQPGQVCADYEEDHAGLCYTKCSILAGPDYPHRGTPWTCCKDSPCKWNRFKHGFGFIACSGFAVAGPQESSACPHGHGSCMGNEELFMGSCYKTCKELTNGQFPYRKAAASCCKTSSTISCMNPMNDQTNANFNVGGGQGDGDPSTPGGPHMPLMA